MSNYPDGAEHDPRAPYNHDESKWTKWEGLGIETCKKCDAVTECDENDICENCFGPEEIDS
jgi:hypothetical protein